MVAVAFGGAYLPLRGGVAALESESDSRQFLEALWQVEAAALALSLAIVIFAFQAVYTVRLRGSLHQFAEDTLLFPIFYVGASALALDAVVLLGLGHDAPAGWAATWCAVWGGVNLVLLAVLFVRTLKAVEPTALRDGRISRARREGRQIAEETIVERLAFHLLNSECESLGLDLSPFLPSQSRTAVAIYPRRPGRVVDIRLRRLRRLARYSTRFQLAPPVVVATIGAAVGGSKALLWLDPVLPRLVPRLARSFRIGRVARARLYESIDQLHEEGLDAIRAGAPARYRDVALAYQEMLLGAEEAWAPYRSRL